MDASSIPSQAGGGGNGTIHAYNKQVVGGMTHTFNQNSILDARIGFTWTQGGKITLSRRWHQPEHTGRHSWIADGCLR